METKRKRDVCKRVVLRMQYMALVAAFDMFSHSVKLLMRHQRIAQRAISRWWAPNLQVGFDMWLRYMDDCRKVSVSEKAKLLNHLHRKVELMEETRQTLAENLAHATVEADKKVEGAVRAEAARRIEQAQRIVRRMLHAQLASAFDSFHRRVTETRGKREACMRVVLRMQHVALAGAWEMFTRTVAQMRTQQQVVARAMSRWRTPSVRTGFELWLEYMEECKLEVLEAEKLQVMHNLDCVDVYLCGLCKRISLFLPSLPSLSLLFCRSLSFSLSIPSRLYLRPLCEVFLFLLLLACFFVCAQP